MAATKAGAPDGVAWALLATLGVVWGGSFTTVGFAVESLPPLTVAAGRLLVGAAILLPLAFLLGDGLPRWRDPVGRRVWAHAAIAAFAANAAPFSLLSWAQTHVPSALAGVFMAALPLVVLPMAARFVPGERMTWAKSLGFVIGFSGVVLLIGVDALGDLGGSSVQILAQIACVGAAVGYGVGSIATKLAPRAHPLSFAAASILLAAVMLTPVALLFERPLEAAWTPGGALAVIGLGAVPTALAMVLLLEVLRRTGPSFLSLVNYQVPIWAMTFGVALLGESPPALAPAALALILIGVAVAQGAPAALARRLRGGGSTSENPADARGA